MAKRFSLLWLGFFIFTGRGGHGVDNWMTIPCSVYRGGTSKGIFIRGSHLPSNPANRDKVILRVFGSPDPRQIDGLGGGTPTTSKLAIIDVSDRTDADVNYTFGQVSIEEASVDYGPNCGNISSAVGPYAVEHGLVQVTGEEAKVRIYNTNSNTVITSTFPVHHGHFVPDGDTSIAGVPGTGSRVVLTFQEVGGAVTGRLLPTGQPRNTIALPDGRSFNVSVIDAGNLTVIMDAKELGIQGTEVTESEFDQTGRVLETMESVRQIVGRELNLFSDGETVTPHTHALPKIACVARPQTYRLSTGEIMDGEDIDIIARVLTMGRLHPSYAVTGAIALAVAANMSGTVVAKTVEWPAADRKILRIGHPSGIFETAAEVEQDSEGGWLAKSVSLVRTARPIMDGDVWVPRSAFADPDSLQG